MCSFSWLVVEILDGNMKDKIWYESTSKGKWGLLSYFLSYCDHIVPWAEEEYEDPMYRTKQCHLCKKLTPQIWKMGIDDGVTCNILCFSLPFSVSFASSLMLFPSVFLCFYSAAAFLSFVFKFTFKFRRWELPCHQEGQKCF